MSAIFSITVEGVVAGPDKIARLVIKDGNGNLLMQAFPESYATKGDSHRQFIIHDGQTITAQLEEVSFGEIFKEDSNHA